MNKTKSIQIVGISTITSNDAAFKQNTIGKLWESFLKNPIKDKLQLSSESIFAVYSDYENKHHGLYKITIGHAVDNTNNIPQELSIVTIPEGNYRQFNPKSQTPEDIIATWKSIWDADMDALQRNYIVDFEEYNESGVKIFIGCDK